MKYIILTLLAAQISFAQSSTVGSSSVASGQNKKSGLEMIEADIIHYKVKEFFESQAPVVQVTKLKSNLYEVVGKDCVADVEVTEQTIYPVIDSNVDAYDATVAELVENSIVCLPN